MILPLILFNYLIGGGVFQQTEASSTKMPFFLFFFEESHFFDPHYQSIVPFENGPVLATLKENGGCDVAAILGLDLTGQ